MKKVMIFGACSAIVSETAKLLAKSGAELCLFDLSLKRLEIVKDDILSYYKTTIHINEFSVEDIDKFPEYFKLAIEQMGSIDTVIIGYGTLPKQLEIQNDIKSIQNEININFSSIALLSTLAVEIFEQQELGTLAVISSVAGDRARKSNYIYGTAKGAVSLYLQGLRNRTSSKNINIITIKPGFVDTPMTKDVDKNILFSKPIDIAKGIVKSIDNKSDIVYLPSFWRLVMFIIKHIPERIFKKLSL